MTATASPGQTEAPESSKARRIDLILRQVDSLPTLPAVATRLLTLTSSEDTSAREVIRLVSSDPSLTAKILSICRKADRGLRDHTMTIDKAVVLLGFNTIRNAVLSIKVFEIFDDPETGSQTLGPGKQDDSGPTNPGYLFPRENFWRHSLAVGIAAELIASVHPSFTDLPASEAFVCGLMHDVGKLALDYVLPKSYARVVEMVETHQGNIAEVERRVIGVDHHTVGKRLSEQWLLPYWIQDCIWLHGSDFDTLPKLGHRRMIGLVTLADLIVRRNHIGYSGNFLLDQDPSQVAMQMGLNPNLVDSITHRLHEELQQRSEALGLNEEPSRELFMQSIQQANQVLGRLNGALDRRTRIAARQAQTLDAITAFHRQASPGRSVQDVFDLVVTNAREVLGPDHYAMMYQAREGLTESFDSAWLVCQYSPQGDLLSSEYVDPPDYSPTMASLVVGQSTSTSLMGNLPWVANHLAGSQDPQSLQMMPLEGGWGVVAVMVHNRPSLPPVNQLQTLLTTWGAAVAGAIQHEGVRRLSEDLAGANRDLAEANRQLAETQEKLLHTESLARLGEMAAGAAHEMNNPLAVISGRGQLLAMGLPPGSKEQVAAQTVVDQSHRLSNLISSMRMFADPPQAQLRTTDIASMLDAVVKSIQSDDRKSEAKKPISLKCQSGLPPARIDPDHLGQAVKEVLLNAMQSYPKTAIHVSADIDRFHGSLVIQVIDDGKGMDVYTLTHAKDPFFSAKSAGRQMGIGLARAQLYVTAHKGSLDLKSSPNTGTVATITIPLDLPQ